MKILIISLYLLASPFLLIGQTTDSIPKDRFENLRFSKKQLIIPGIFITYGISSMESDYLKLLNKEVDEELHENIDEKFTIDDFSQYAPALTVYGLNALGVKGKNNFKDRTLVLTSSFLMMSATVLSLKTLTHVKRPDGSANNSFPSGHTANAFLGAEFLYQEYKDINIWVGIAGYGVAAGTGFFRMYNQRHWLSDVVMGAGIGILTTKIAYWTLPYYQDKIFRSNKNIHSSIAPFYNGRQAGIGMVFTLQ